MLQGSRIARIAVIGVVAWLGNALARPASAVDLSGVYASVHELFSTPCTLTFVQSGTALTIDGPCQFGFPTNYVFELSGTVDELTGDFSTSGVLHGLCETPGSVTMIGTGDGFVFSAISACGSVSAGISGAKCNNGMLDSNEDCEDGNTAAGDCCSPTCQYEAAGMACAADTNLCTLDQCDGAGSCVHSADPGAAGQPCTSDGNACTLDQCDAAGTCLHPADAGAAGQPCQDDYDQCTDDVCNAVGQCTHPFNTDPCDDINTCTGPDACVSGVCSGPVLPDCAGSIDLTGDWRVTSTSGFFSASPARRFVQTGATLESTDLATGMRGPGTVNPATGAFQVQTPFTVIFYPCIEVITATATTDAQEFTGTSMAYCGLEGNFGPFDVTGERCDPVVGCACDIAACVDSDLTSRVVVTTPGGMQNTRWRWSHSPITGWTFGDPLVSDYRICLKSPGGSFYEEVMHGANWRTTRTGYRYTNSTGAVRRVWLRTTPDQMSLTATVVPSSPVSLPLTTPVTLRFIRLGGQPFCAEATFDAPAVNSPQRFRAKE